MVPTAETFRLKQTPKLIRDSLRRSTSSLNSGLRVTLALTSFWLAACAAKVEPEYSPVQPPVFGQSTLVQPLPADLSQFPDLNGLEAGKKDSYRKTCAQFYRLVKANYPDGFIPDEDLTDIAIFSRVKILKDHCSEYYLVKIVNGGVKVEEK